MSAQETQVDKSSARVRAMFGEIAPRYDFLNNFLSVGLAKLWRRRLVSTVFQALSESPGELRSLETLDVATGTGDVIIETHRQWRKHYHQCGRFSGLKTFGVDFVPAMLSLAQDKITRRGLSNVELSEGDGLALPFESNRFDAATISFGLRNMEDPARGIAEMTRVCRPGGVVAILEFSPTSFPIFAPIFKFYFHKILPAIGQAVAKNSKEAYRYLPASVDAFDSADVILEYMRQSGLEDVRHRSMTFGVLGLSIGRKRS